MTMRNNVPSPKKSLIYTYSANTRTTTSTLSLRKKFEPYTYIDHWLFFIFYTLTSK